MKPKTPELRFGRFVDRGTQRRVEATVQAEQAVRSELAEGPTTKKHFQRLPEPPASRTNPAPPVQARVLDVGGTTDWWSRPRDN